jgi:hypothetical protein
MTLDELLAKGIHALTDGCFLRSAPMLLNNTTLEDLRQYTKTSEANRVVWAVGREVRQRLLNRDVLGSPKEFTISAGPGEIIGHLSHADVHGFTNDALWNPEGIIVIALGKYDDVLRYTGVMIDVDREH